MSEKEFAISVEKVAEAAIKLYGDRDTLIRNAVPYLLKNNSKKPLIYDGAEVRWGEYFAVQPSGSFHKTDFLSHNFGGKHLDIKYNVHDIKSVEDLALQTGCSYTKPEHIKAAIEQNMRNK